MAGVQGMKHTRPMSAIQRDNLALANIEKMLDDQASGKIKLTPERIKAIEIRYSRLRPTLSAVEQTTIDESAKLSEADLMAQLAALIEAHPDLVQQALAARARKVAESIERDAAQSVALVPDVPRETTAAPDPALKKA